MCQGVLVGPPAPQLLPVMLEASVHCHTVPRDKDEVLLGVLSPHWRHPLHPPDWIRSQHGVLMLGIECVTAQWFFLQIPFSQVLFLAVEAHLPVLAPRKRPLRVEESPCGPGSCVRGYDPWGWHSLAQCDMAW